MTIPLSKQVFLSILFILILNFSFGQTNFQEAVNALDGGDINTAIEQFKKALKDKDNKVKAQLFLTLLYSNVNEHETGAKQFTNFFDQVENPYPELYAMWFSNSVVGPTSEKKTETQLEFLKRLENEAANKDKLLTGTLYRLFADCFTKKKKDLVKVYYEKVGGIKDWQLVGPFDNVINSGFDKDFGVLSTPTTGKGFTSKYGATVDWFTPELKPVDPYMFKYNYFQSSNSLIYAQTFVEGKGEEVLLKLGFSGSLKLWVNDQLIFSESEHRVTDNDYYQFKYKLNNGYNRILVQLGDYEERSPNFCFRITDLAHNNSDLTTVSSYQSYKKSTNTATVIPYFALEPLKTKSRTDQSNLYKLLLAKAYMRSFEMNKAEQQLLLILEDQPKHFLGLKQLISLYSKTNNQTNLNKYYDIFEKAFPDDIEILSSKVAEYIEERNKEKTREYIHRFNEKFPDEMVQKSYAIILASIDSDTEKMIEMIEELYEEYPNDVNVLDMKYSIITSVEKDKKNANALLEEYLKNNFSYKYSNILASNYFEDGEEEKTYALLKDCAAYNYLPIPHYKKLIGYYSKKLKYKEAIEVCNLLLKTRPYDHSLYKDLGILHQYSKNKKKAIEYYETSLKYYPFSFETTEEIRELNDRKRALDYIEELDYMALIKEAEKEFNPETKQSFSIVYNSYSNFITKARTTALIHEYIIKLNDESGIERWKEINFSPGSFNTLYFDELKTIKPNGQTIDADRNQGNVVFTGLEIGDYVHIRYHEKQTYGGKSSLFFSDNFMANRLEQDFKVEYNLIVENGVETNIEYVNDKIDPQVEKLDGYTKYSWKFLNTQKVEREDYSPYLYDLSNVIHVSTKQSWQDIAQWYSDLSGEQSKTDLTIKKLAKQITQGKQMTDEQKVRAIYEFICSTVKYSYVDFRQSGYIPQKASDVYHTRLGDCKDMSVLFAALSKEMGIKTNLVLINTVNNGKKNVVLPSLNFNHCIVRTYLGNGPIYLELTNPNLPFGHLYEIHEGAAILEIPIDGVVSANAKLEYLMPNSQFTTHVIRNKTIEIRKDNVMKIDDKVEKTGRRSESMISNYYDLNDKTLKESLKNAIANDFNSSIDLLDYDFHNFNPRKEKINYTLKFEVDNDVLKLGSMRSVKLPFSDILTQAKVFDEDGRQYAFKFNRYEDTERYESHLNISLDPQSTFIEIPEDIKLSHAGNSYELSFKKINAYTIQVKRIYLTDRKNVPAAQYTSFKEFMIAINDAENTHLLFK